MTPPVRHPYDPGDPYPERAFEGRCPLLVLLATPDVDPEWAAESAVALARQWADLGERVCLADLAFSGPRIHGVLGLTNEEGMSDLFLFGASLGRVARQASPGLFFTSAGTPIADPAAVLGSSRWALLTQGFANAGAHLLVYLPLEERGSAGVVAHAERILLLSGPNGSDALEAIGAAQARVAGVLTPRTGRGATPSAAGAAARPAPGGPPAAVGAAKPSLPAQPAATPAGAAPTPKTLGKQKPPQSFLSSTWRMLLIVGVSLLLLLAVLIMLRVIPVPWLADNDPADPSGEPEMTVGVAPPDRRSAPDPLAGSYFLALGSYAEGAIAMLQVEQLGSRRSDLLFVVSPVESNGVVLHRLLVGETEDSAAAELRASLSRTLTQENPAEWQVRAGPLSFHLGTFETRAAADARVDELQLLNVPAYVLRQPPTVAPERYDVWAGAYADSVEATYLERTLNDQGIVPILLRRTGELLPE
jgi:hypothetical protein